MKNFAVNLVWFTTIFLFVFTGLCQTNIPLPLISSLFLSGSILFMYTVYRVLTDKYKTKKTFEDWYQDIPKKKLDKEENSLI